MSAPPPAVSSSNLSPACAYGGGAPEPGVGTSHEDSFSRPSGEGGLAGGTRTAGAEGTAKLPGAAGAGELAGTEALTGAGGVAGALEVAAACRGGVTRELEATRGLRRLQRTVLVEALGFRALALSLSPALSVWRDARSF